MKGQVFVYGGIVLSVILIFVFMVKISAVGEVRRAVASSEGKLVSFVNYANFLIKEFDESLEFISQRTAYELGKGGGLKSSLPVFWNSTYPSLDTLRGELENAIEENLPQGTTEGNRIVNWESGVIEVTESSNYFFVKGEKRFSIYDESIDSRIYLNPHEFNKKINSNYFKFLNAGRTIFEDPNLNSELDDYGNLLNMLNSDSRFSDLVFSGSLIDDNTVEIVIKEMGACYPSDTYCLAPLKTTESGFDPSIPYDFVELRIRYLKDQTSFTEPDFDFSILLNSPDGVLEVVCVE
jgi:hypothetical protein